MKVAVVLFTYLVELNLDVYNDLAKFASVLRKIKW